MDTKIAAEQTKYNGVKGWLLFLCLCLTIFGPLGALTRLGSLTETELYFILGLIGLSIVSGVFLWCRQPVGVILAKTFFITGLIVDALSILSMITQREMSQRVLLVLLYSAPQVGWLIYIFQSKRVKATYSPALRAEAEARLERGRQAIENDIKSTSVGLWIVVVAAVVFTAVVLTYVFSSNW